MRWRISTWWPLHGGFSLAARASGRAKATLSRQQAELEEALGLRLIDRDGGGGGSG